MVCDRPMYGDECEYSLVSLVICTTYFNDIVIFKVIFSACKNVKCCIDNSFRS